MFSRIAKELETKKLEMQFDIGGYTFGYDNAKINKNKDLEIDLTLNSSSRNLPCSSFIKTSLLLTKEGKIRGPGLDKIDEEGLSICLSKQLANNILSILKEELSSFSSDWIKIEQLELVYKDLSGLGKIPIGVKVYSHIKIQKFFTIGLPPVVFDFSHGFKTSDFDRILFTIAGSVPIPPFALTDLGGQIAKDSLLATGKITLVEGELAQLVHLLGNISVPLNGGFSVRQQGDLVLFNSMKFASSESVLRVEPLSYEVNTGTGKILDDLLQFHMNFKYLDGKLTGQINGFFLDKNALKINGQFEASKSKIAAKTQVDLIVQQAEAELMLLFGPSLYAKLSAGMNVEVAGQKISNVRVFVEPSAAGINFKFVGLNLGTVVPSYKSLNKELIWDLIKNLLSIELEDLPKLVENILKGNININPFSDIGSHSDGGDSEGGKGESSSTIGNEQIETGEKSQAITNPANGATSSTISDNNSKDKETSKTLEGAKITAENNRDTSKDGYDFKGDGIDQISIEQIARMNRSLGKKEFEDAFSNPSRKAGILFEQKERGNSVKTFAGKMPGEYYKFAYDDKSKTWTASADQDTVKELNISATILNQNDSQLPTRFKRIRRKVSSGVVGFYDDHHLYFYSQENPEGVRILMDAVQWKEDLNNPFWLIYKNGLEDLLAKENLPQNHVRFEHDGDIVYRICEDDRNFNCYTFILDIEENMLWLPRLSDGSYDRIMYSNGKVVEKYESVKKALRAKKIK